MKHFCFGLICKVDVKVQNNHIIFNYMNELHGENIKGKLLFQFNLQGGCVGPKIVLFFSFAWVGHMDIIIEINFCFGLICKMVVEVQRSYIHFIYMGAPCMYNFIFIFSLSNLSKKFMNFIDFLSSHFLFLFYLLFLCAMEIQENLMFSVNKNCLLHGNLQNQPQTLKYVATSNHMHLIVTF